MLAHVELSVCLHHAVQCSHSRFVKRAMHGTRMLSWSEIRTTYGRELVNLRNEGRWQFLNTLFSVSEAVMYMQVKVAVTTMSAFVC